MISVGESGRTPLAVARPESAGTIHGRLRPNLLIIKRQMSESTMRPILVQFRGSYVPLSTHVAGRKMVEKDL